MKKKIKLLISSNHLDYGGMEKSLVNLINNLDSKKFDITLVLEQKYGVYLSSINKNIKILEYSPNSNSNYFVRKSTNFLKRIGWIIRYFNRFDISICYSTYSLSSNLIARLSSKKRIYWIHNDYTKIYKDDIDRINLFFSDKHLHLFNKIMFVSNESRDNLCKCYPNIIEKSVVINNIIDIEDILSKSKVSVKVKPRTAVYVGRIDENQKSITTIVDLANKCKEKKLDINFLIIGDGPDLKTMIEKAEKLHLNNIDFLGSVSNPYKYMVKASFLLLTSNFEGFPVVYNEAIILHKPILTTIYVSDDEIKITDFGIVSTKEDLYKNIEKILSFKQKKIDFGIINERRIEKIEKILLNI